VGRQGQPARRPADYVSDADLSVGSLREVRPWSARTEDGGELVRSRGTATHLPTHEGRRPPRGTECTRQSRLASPRGGRDVKAASRPVGRSSHATRRRRWTLARKEASHTCTGVV